MIAFCFCEAQIPANELPALPVDAAIIVSILFSFA